MKKYIYFYILLFILTVTHINTSAAENIKNSFGQLNNLVVLVEFADDENYYNDKFYSILEHSYNSSGEFDSSAKNYFSQVSRKKLTFNGVFMKPKKSSRSVRLSKNRSYYMPKSYFDQSPTNEKMAYDNSYYKDGKECAKNEEGAKKHIDGAIRENLMVREIISKLEMPDSKINLDNNDDGLVDNITFILSGNVVTDNKFIWGELLWPHMTSLYDIDNNFINSFYLPSQTYLKDTYNINGNLGDVFINEKQVCNYNILSAAYMFNTVSHTFRDSDSCHVGVICHEVMHILGIMDYYSYEPHKKDYSSVGPFDLMATTTKNPQYLLSYLRLKMGWLNDDNIVTINKGGNFTLYPTSSQNKVCAVKISLKNFDTQEFFMIEARSDKSGIFDNHIGGTGIIVYRVDPAAAQENGFLGNMYGNDEIYVFRRFDFEKNKYHYFADSALLKENEIYGSNDEKCDRETIFYQGTDNAKLKGVNSKIKIFDISINSDNSISFSIKIK